MRTLMGLVAILATTLANGGAVAIPAGLFAGKAEWRGPGGATGSYTVERSFVENEMTARFAWSEDTASKKEEYALTFAVSAAPVFDVLDPKGKVVGRGHCFDDSCSYRAEYGGVQVEEALRWTAQGMSVLGAKSGPGFSVVWKETLHKR